MSSMTDKQTEIYNDFLTEFKEIFTLPTEEIRERFGFYDDDIGVFEDDDETVGGAILYSISEIIGLYIEAREWIHNKSYTDFYKILRSDNNPLSLLYRVTYTLFDSNYKFEPITFDKYLEYGRYILTTSRGIYYGCDNANSNDFFKILDEYMANEYCNDYLNSFN